MKTKYIMNVGLAFTEKKDIKKLEKLASEGWLLQEFAFNGFMYKLVQGPKQDLTYTIDFQTKPDTDYFDIFSSAGWQHITSLNKQIHIFSAPKGTAPIYSDNEIKEGKYQEITSALGKGAWYSLLALMVFASAMIISKSHFEILYYPLFFITIINLAALIFCFMPFVAYKIKQQRNN